MLFNMPHGIGADPNMTPVTQASHVFWYAATPFCDRRFDNYLRALTLRP